MAGKTVKLTDEQYIERIIDDPRSLTEEDYNEITSRGEKMAGKLLGLVKISGELGDFVPFVARDELLLSLLSSFDKPYHFDHLIERICKWDIPELYTDYLVIAGKTHGKELFDKVVMMFEQGQFPNTEFTTVFQFFLAAYQANPDMRNRITTVIEKHIKEMWAKAVEENNGDAYSDMIVLTHALLSMRDEELKKIAMTNLPDDDDILESVKGMIEEIEEDSEITFTVPTGLEYFMDVMADDSLFAESSDECECGNPECKCDDEECVCDDEECKCKDNGHTHHHHEHDDECGCGHDHNHGSLDDIMPSLSILNYSSEKIESLTDDELIDCLKDFHIFMPQQMINRIKDKFNTLSERLAALVLEEKSWQFRQEKENYAALLALFFLGVEKNPVTIDVLDKIRNFEFVYDNLIGIIPDLVVSQGMEAVEKLKSAITDHQKSDDYCSAILTGTMIYYFEKADKKEKKIIEDVLLEALKGQKKLEKPVYTSYEISCSAIITEKAGLKKAVRELMEKWGSDFSFSERDMVSLSEYKQMTPHFVLHDYAELWESTIKDIAAFRRKLENGTHLLGTVKKLISDEESEKLFKELTNDVLARDIVLLNHQISRFEINEIISRGKAMLPLLDKIAFDTEFENKDVYGKAFGSILAMRFIGMLKDPDTIPLICEILRQKQNNGLLCYDGALILAQFGSKSISDVKNLLFNTRLSERLRAYLQDTLIRMAFLFEEMEEPVKDVFKEYFARISKKPDGLFVMIKAMSIVKIFGDDSLSRKAVSLYKKHFGDGHLGDYTKKMMDSGIYTGSNMCQGPESLLSDEEILSLVYADEKTDFGYKSDESDESSEQKEQPVETFVREDPKVGRNDPCPCGSGKKYKKCCGQ